MKIRADDYFNKIEDIPQDYFSQKALRAVILDIDNTLLEEGSFDMQPQVLEWVKSIGLPVCFVSNGKERRVRHFAELFGFMYVFGALKPFKKGFLKAFKLFNAATLKPDSPAQHTEPDPPAQDTEPGQHKTHTEPDPPAQDTEPGQHETHTEPDPPTQDTEPGQHKTHTEPDPPAQDTEPGQHKTHTEPGQPDASASLITPSQVAVIGDQLLTDILGGNRAGCYTIKIEPINTAADPASVKIKRWLERFFR